MRLRLPAPPVRGSADDQQAETAPRRTWTVRASAVAARRLRVPGRAFAAITVVPALLAVAWLVPGTGMLLAGRLAVMPMVIIFVPLAVALCYFAMRRQPVSWPRFNEAELNEAEPDAAPVAVQRKPDVPAVALLAMLVIAAGFGVWQAVFRSEQIFVTSDAIQRGGHAFQRVGRPFRGQTFSALSRLALARIPVPLEFIRNAHKGHPDYP